MGSRRPEADRDETINPRRRFRTFAPDGATTTATGLRMSEKKRNAQSQLWQPGRSRRSDAQRARNQGWRNTNSPSRIDREPRRFHAQFILEHAENPSKAARESLRATSPCRHARNPGLPVCLLHFCTAHDHSSRPGSRLIQSRSRRAAEPNGSAAPARLESANQRASEKPGPGLSSPEVPRAT
jgi:hypothetical protein